MYECDTIAGVSLRSPKVTKSTVATFDMPQCHKAMRNM